jgi:hypothetical protein
MAAVETAEAYDDETFDDEFYAGESVDDEAEFLGTLLGGPAAAIGNLVGGILGPRPAPPRPPLPPVNVSPAGPGVSTATLQTPQGSATLRLPQPVVTRQELENVLKPIQEGINRDAARVNTISREIEDLRTRVGAVVADTQRDVGQLKTSLKKSQSAQRAAIARLRREQSNQQTMSLLMTVMMQGQVRRLVENHEHVSGAVEFTDGGDNTALMFLPLMMSGGGGGDSSMSMMLPMMMLAMNK